MMLRDSLRELVGSFEADRYTGDDAAELVKVFSEIESLACSGKFLAVGRVTATQVHARQGHKNPGTWFAAVTGKPVGEAIAELRDAQEIAAIWL